MKIGESRQSESESERVELNVADKVNIRNKYWVIKKKKKKKKNEPLNIKKVIGFKNIDVAHQLSTLCNNLSK